MSYTLRFACGAIFSGVKEVPNFAHQDKQGRGRMCVYDSEGGSQSPMLNGEPAPCLSGCPEKRAGKRKQIACINSEGRLFPGRAIVLCYAEVIP